MTNTLDNYPDKVYSLCLVCKHYKDCGNGYYKNRPSASALNVLPSHEYSCKHARFETTHVVPYRYDCTSFVEDRKKVNFYKKRYERGNNKKK